MWFIKIIAKILLSRLPVPQRLWKRIGIFRLGQMEAIEYANGVFLDHLSTAYPSGLPKGATVLELGVGDSLASALIARAYGAKKIYLIDVGSYARLDISFYKTLADGLLVSGLQVPDIRQAKSVEEMLRICNAEYLTSGLESLRTIPDGSVDFIWSQAVLEHVRKAQFAETANELRRVLKSSGTASHVVDFKDHLTDALNSLRFPEKVWESNFFANSGFYTNRIPAPAMLTLLQACGYSNLRVQKEWRWPRLPTRRSVFDPAFQNIPEDALLVNCMKVTMQR